MLCVFVYSIMFVCLVHVIYVCMCKRLFTIKNIDIINNFGGGIFLAEDYLAAFFIFKKHSWKYQ